MCGVWVPDWSGQQRYSEGVRPVFNWQLDQERYPSWSTMVTTWASDNVKVLLYINPYLSLVSSDLYIEALSNNYFIKNSDSQVLLV
jgi:alpha-glucosidase (family GH31 glycosyl hydrolase)